MDQHNDKWCILDYTCYLDVIELDWPSRNICSKPMSFKGYAYPLYVGLNSNSQFF